MSSSRWRMRLKIALVEVRQHVDDILSDWKCSNLPRPSPHPLPRLHPSPTQTPTPRHTSTQTLCLQRGVAATVMFLRDIASRLCAKWTTVVRHVEVWTLCVCCDQRAAPRHVWTPSAVKTGTRDPESNLSTFVGLENSIGLDPMYFQICWGTTTTITTTTTTSTTTATTTTTTTTTARPSV